MFYCDCAQRPIDFNWTFISLFMSYRLPAKHCLAIFCAVILIYPNIQAQHSIKLLKPLPLPLEQAVLVEKNVRVKEYFEYLDQLIQSQDTSSEFILTEHLLVRHNPWLIERLANTDYYRQMAAGQFIHDQKQMVVLKAGDTLRLPTAEQAWALLEQMRATRLDINIPEYKMRILQNQDTLFGFMVRVGQRTEKYLETAGKELDLRTQTGKGKIVAVNKNADWVNPVDGHQYTATRRDDGKVTACPRIPWLEPELNGERLGQLIHPTTNPATLGKVYSNGCIGLSEADAWYAYYYAPIGTPLAVRYELEIPGQDGEKVLLPDIYGKNEGRIGSFKVLKGLQAEAWEK